MSSLCQVSDLDFEVEEAVLALVLGVIHAPPLPNLQLYPPIPDRGFQGGAPQSVHPQLCSLLDSFQALLQQELTTSCASLAGVFLPSAGWHSSSGRPPCPSPCSALPPRAPGPSAPGPCWGHSCPACRGCSCAGTPSWQSSWLPGRTGWGERGGGVWQGGKATYPACPPLLPVNRRLPSTPPLVRQLSQPRCLSCLSLSSLVNNFFSLGPAPRAGRVMVLSVNMCFVYV